MATKRAGEPRPKMIHCEFCGEDYASSYKRCPFCDEAEADEDYYYEDEDEEVRPKAGKRLAGGSRSSNSRGGGYGGSPSPLSIIFTVVSLALIIAAVIIVITIIKPLVDRGKTTLPDSTPNNVISPTPGSGHTASPAPGASGAPGVTGNPGGTVGTGVTQPPVPPTAAPTPTQSIPAGQTATGFTLNKSEFTISNQWPAAVTLKVTFIPAGSTGTITWSSSNSDIAAVDANGRVSHGTKTGTATITATMAGGVTQTCRVHNSVTSSGGTAGSSTGTASGSSGGSASAGTSPTLSRSDFTLVQGESWKIRVSGNSGTPTWSIGNTAVATVSGDGTVTYVGPGKTTLTCTVDGQTLTCIVRCKS